MTKPTKWHVHPAKTQISLGVRPVWSESSLCAQWVAKGPSFLHAESEDWSDWADAQADLSLRWAHMPFCWFCHVAAQIKGKNIHVCCRSSYWIPNRTERKKNLLLNLYMSNVMRKLVYVICEQQRHKSACASAQCDQHLCYSLPR